MSRFSLKSNLYKRIVISLVALNLIGLAIYGMSALAHRLLPSTNAFYNPRMAQMYISNGIMSGPEFSKSRALYTQLSQGKSFSDQDINWLIQLVSLPPQHATSSVAVVIRHDTGMELLEAGLKTGKTTAEQKDKIFNAAIPLLASKDTTGLEAISATNVLRTLNDKRAIPLLLPLVNSPNPQVRTTVVNSLKVMGYNSGT